MEKEEAGHSELILKALKDNGIDWPTYSEWLTQREIKKGSYHVRFTIESINDFLKEKQHKKWKEY